MNPARIPLAALAAAVVLLAVPRALSQVTPSIDPDAPRVADVRRLIAGSEITLVGRVTRPDGAGFADVPADVPTSVIRVIEVLEQPEGSPMVRAGDQITLARAAPLGAGATAIFSTTVWIAGEGLALREVSRRPLDGPPPARELDALRRDVAEARRSIRADAFRASAERASSVFTGRVLEVREVASGEAASKRITEHDPEWREAVVAVEEAYSGAAKGERVIIRFPSSADVAFRGTPRLVENQVRLFALPVDTVSGLVAAKINGAEAASFVLRNAAEVLDPKKDVELFEKVIRSLPIKKGR